MKEDDTMEMCYDGALVMPKNYVVMNEEEMTYVEGGITIEAVCAIICTTIAVNGAFYGAGMACGERLYYAGITTQRKWSKYKWQARAIAIRLGGGIFMLGLENKLYSMMQ